MTNAGVRSLKARIEKLGQSDLERLPRWLGQIPCDDEDAAEFRAIVANYRGFAVRKRFFEFVAEMRRKYPNSKRNVDEEIEEGGRAYVKQLEEERR